MAKEKVDLLSGGVHGFLFETTVADKAISDFLKKFGLNKKDFEIDAYDFENEEIIEFDCSDLKEQEFVNRLKNAYAFLPNDFDIYDRNFQIFMFLTALGYGHLYNTEDYYINLIYHRGKRYYVIGLPSLFHPME
jgi:hypothetical protein